jgi:hypothetical protein
MFCDNFNNFFDVPNTSPGICSFYICLAMWKYNCEPLWQLRLRELDTKFNFICAFMFSNPLLRDRLFCVVPKGNLSMRIKFYIYVIPQYRVPWLDIYKYPLPDTCTLLWYLLYYFLFLMRVYLSTNLWNFYTNKTVYSSTVYHLIKISKETPIWYTYLVKGTCIRRAMEHGILELHRCRIWYAYA